MNRGVYEDILNFVKDLWFWEYREEERESLRMFANGYGVFRYRL